jgi:hypothetical protein
MSGVEDPRQTGFNRVRFSDRNGEKLDVYTMTAQRFRVWAGCIIAIFTVCGMVFAAARFGVGVEVHQAIEEEATLETGAIHREIHRCTEEYMDEVLDVIQDDMSIFDGRMEDMEIGQVAIIGSVDGLKAQSERSVEEIKLLLRRAIAESP